LIAGFSLALRIEIERFIEHGQGREIMLYGIEDLHLVVDPEFGNRSYAQIIFNRHAQGLG